MGNRLQILERKFGAESLWNHAIAMRRSEDGLDGFGRSCGGRLEDGSDGLETALDFYWGSGLFWMRREGDIWE